MKKTNLLLLTFFGALVYGQVGINTQNPQGIFHIDGTKDNPITGTPTSPQQLNDLIVTEEGNVGIGNINPTAKLEITSGIPDISGLKFNNINSSSTPNHDTASLGIDASGNVVVQSRAPILTDFKAFSINGNVATNSLITIGTLQFRYATTNCSSSPSFLQVLSTSGADNKGVIHNTYKTAQDTSNFVNTTPLTITNTFTDIPATSLNCIQDGHTQFSFFSYTDRTYYRVSVHIADGDSLGFGAFGYIFVELQR
ncbi:hypothetical protein D1631_10000 [Chryseobacterium nematophagum]|uniref:C1q domain-containing protein n=1 Tax=Chryseobacterium nematophagum TaxID=2305228 RepID=A0A3M7TJ61_9FLAO|nr:hypothetical protein [Chryseobacterium nematophagum]RNA62240.1 hypothetical protein D1631_10000 [Chryseobacterium nematophagum]